MAEVTNELIYETLRTMQDRLGRVGTRLERIEDRMAHVEELMAGIVKDTFPRNSEMTALERRVARIEARLELRDADA